MQEARSLLVDIVENSNEAQIQLDSDWDSLVKYPGDAIRRAVLYVAEDILRRDESNSSIIGIEGSEIIYKKNT